MFLGGSKKKHNPEGVNPFAAIETGGAQPAGPGVGAERTKLFTIAMKRRRYAAQALGDTPQRDGPFAPGAAPIAKALPPKTRVEQRRSKGDNGGINPFAVPANSRATGAKAR